MFPHFQAFRARRGGSPGNGISGMEFAAAPLATAEEVHEGFERERQREALVVDREPDWSPRSDAGVPMLDPPGSGIDPTLDIGASLDADLDVPEPFSALD